MKYAINWARNFRYFNDVDEVILNNIPSDLEKIKTFLEEGTLNKRTKIILNLAEIGISSPKLQGAPAIINMLKSQGWNISVKINREDKDLFKSNNISFFYNIFAKNLEQVYTQAFDGVSEIYITEELGFRLKDLQNIKELFNIKYRVIPNIVQSADNKIFEPITSFWIRPEDTELYEPLVDTFELLGGENESRISVIYEVYKQRQWLGDINDIILDFNSDIKIPNTGMNPHFAQMRINCGKKCLTGSPCNVCHQMADLALKFNEVGLEVIKKREKPQKTKEEIEQALTKLKERANELGINEDTNNS